MKVEALQAEGLCKSYGDNSVLRDLDLVLEPGKIYGLIGRNGAGKTTLLGCLTAQTPVDSGAVTYGGRPVWENQSVLDQICFSREFSFRGASQGGYNLKQYLGFAALLLPHWDRAYAARLMGEFKLEEKKRLSQFSKGQLSMVTILVALASMAPLTILDEPVTGLDVVMRERFYQLLLEDYVKTGRTFLISTHIIEQAASVFEQVLILDDGRILENAPTGELVDEFRCVSGRADVVEEAVRGLTVLSEQTLGRRSTAVVRGDPSRLAALSTADVDVTPMNLQGVFVALCGHGDTQ